MTLMARPFKFQSLNDVLRARAEALIADQVQLPEIQKATHLRESTIRWVAYKAGLQLMTRRGPTKDKFKAWRGECYVPCTLINSPHYAAMAANLRW